MAIQLTIAKGAQVGAQAVFDQPEILIGRTEDNDVVLLQGGVSRRHARLFLERGAVWAEDLGSANGTFVNGESLERARQLHPGDELGVGAVVLSFTLAEGAEPSPELSDTHILAAHGVSQDPEEPSYDAPAGTDEALQAEEPSFADAPEHSEPGTSPDAFGPEGDEPSELTDGGTVPVDASTVAEAIEAQSTRLVEVGFAESDEASISEAIEAQSTRLVDVGPRLDEEVLPVQGGLALERVQTRMLELPIPAREAAVRRKLRSAEAGLEGAPSVALARATPRGGVRPVSAGPVVRSAAIRGKLAKMDAVDRVRLRRDLQDTLGGQLRLWWLDLEPGPRRITLATLGVLGLMVAASLWFVFRPDPGRAKAVAGPEATMLTSEPLADSFGLGEGVTWKRADQKAFGFEFVAPTRAVALLHFEAADISAGEVFIVLNGQELGEVEADAAGVRDREHEWVLPLLQLRRGEPNQVIFDNRFNPPGNETWRIARPWIEIIPVPELAPAALLASAREHTTRGNDLVEARLVGSDNLFNAWKAYRSAWITLEPLPEHPPLYHDVRFRMGQLKSELDTLCGTLLLDFQRAIELGPRRKARASLEEVLRRFPTPEHRCHNLARARAREHAL